MCTHERKDDVATLDAEFQKCHDDVSGVVQGGTGVNMEARHREVDGGKPPCAGAPGGQSLEEPTAALLGLTAEFTDMSRELRGTIGFRGATVNCSWLRRVCEKSSLMPKKAAGGRVVYVYASGCAYDRRRPESKPGRSNLKRQRSGIRCAKLLGRASGVNLCSF